jgi:hypothetical protein
MIFKLHVGVIISYLCIKGNISQWKHIIVLNGSLSCHYSTKMTNIDLKFNNGMKLHKPVHTIGTKRAGKDRMAMITSRSHFGCIFCPSVSIEETLNFVGICEIR